MIAVPFILNALFNFAIGLLIAKFLGPSEYGRFALALSTAIVLQTLCFDWLRFAATRFYSEQDRRGRPEIRATLNIMFAILATLAVCAAGAIAVSGLQLPLSRSLVAVAIVTSVTNGLFDFSAALVRARFLDRPYGLLVVVKNLLSLGLTVGGAWYFGSAKAALAGMALSIAGSLAVSRGTLKDQAARFDRFDGGLALRFAGYALPIVLANVLYQTVPLINRGIVAQVHSFAESGQLALAFETGIRIVGAIGTSVDVFLFQLAVRAEKRFGVAAAHERISANMGVVFAIVLPVICGSWLVLPSFERLFIPEHFRGSFAHYFTLTLPAMAAFALISYGVGPAFQIAHRTRPLIICGLAGVAADGLAIALLPALSDASGFALAQSISSCTALVVMLIFLMRLPRMRPRLRDVLGVIVAAGAMVAAVLPTRSMAPALLSLLLQAGMGITVYGFVAWLCDVAHLRSLLVPRLLDWRGERRARTI